MDEKTKELICIGASVSAHCQPCLNYHVAKARELGIDDASIREAVGAGHQVERGSMAAMKQFAEALFSAPLGNATGVAEQGHSKN